MSKKSSSYKAKDLDFSTKSCTDCFYFSFWSILEWWKYWNISTPTCESEGAWENDVDSCAVDVKHDAEVNGYTAEHRETVNERPVGGV